MFIDDDGHYRPENHDLRPDSDEDDVKESDYYSDGDAQGPGESPDVAIIIPPMNTPEDFLRVIWGGDLPNGWVNVFAKDADSRVTTNSWPTTQVSGAVNWAMSKNLVANVWFGIGLRGEDPGPGKRGSVDDVSAIPGFWFDLDVRGPGHTKTELPPTMEAAEEFLKTLPLKPTLIVYSGGGMQLYWLFHEPVCLTTQDVRKQVMNLSTRWHLHIKAEGNQHGWDLDNTGDLPRVFRVPGTLNRKTDPPVPVTVPDKHVNLSARYHLADFEAVMPIEEATTTIVQTASVPSSHVHLPTRRYQAASLQLIVPKCAWLRHCHDDAETLDEPEWRDMISILARCQDGERHCHKWSTPYKKYTPAETNAKIKNSLDKGGPRTCEGIKADFGDHCEGCSETVKSPIVLGITHINQADAWEPDLHPWPTLSREALPGIVGEFIDLATRDSEADPAAVLATFLTRFGAEIYGQQLGAGPCFYVNETKHFPRLFAAIVGATAHARKGTSMGPVKTLFEWTDAHAGVTSPLGTAQLSSGPLSSGEGIANSVRDQRDAWKIDKNGHGSMIIADPGVSDKRLFISDEEFAAALVNSGREGSILSPAMRCFWDSGSYAPITKHDPIKTTDAHVCIVTHITAHELASKLGTVQAFNGFANRFLWVCSKRSGLVPRPKRMPKAELAALHSHLSGKLNSAKVCGVVDFDEDGGLFWDGVYSELTADHPGLVGGIISRGAAQARRLALIYAMLDGKSYIGEEHIRAALAFWDYCKASAMYLFSGRDSNEYANKIIDALKEGPLTTTDLHRAMGNNAKKNDLNLALQDLMASGRVAQAKVKTGGKPSKVFSLRNRVDTSPVIIPVDDAMGE